MCSGHRVEVALQQEVPTSKQVNPRVRQVGGERPCPVRNKDLVVRPRREQRTMMDRSTRAAVGRGEVLRVSRNNFSWIRSLPAGWTKRVVMQPGIRADRSGPTPRVCTASGSRSTPSAGRMALRSPGCLPA